MTTIFGGCHVVLDLTTSVSFRRKQEIRKKITDNDGIVSYIVTKKSTHVVCNDPAKADISYKCKMGQKYGIPVVSVSFLYDCVEKGRLLCTDDYLVIGKTRSQKLGYGKIAATKYQILGKRRKSSFYPGGVKAWPLQEKHTPVFNSTKYQVAKYAVLQKYVKSARRTFFCVLEVHVTEERDLLQGQIHRFRVSKHHGNLKNVQEGKSEKMECYYVETSEEATKMYSFLYKQQTDHPNLMEVSHDAPPRGVGTLNFQKMMMAFGLEKAELSTPVCELVEGIWKEAYSDLSEILTSPSSVKLEQIEKAEALLMKLRGEPEDKQSVLSEFYSALPHNTKVAVSNVNNSWLSTEQDICQVMKDMLTVSEATGWSLRGSTESKYRALRCQIEHRAPDHHVYKTVKALINKSLDGNTRLNIVNIFEVQRQMEEDNFTKDIFDQTLLFHASKPNNFVGILSRGLLMPKVVVGDFGGKRTDAGMLGAGIYFASAASTSVKYSQVSKSRGTRMMLVNKVALGKCMDLHKHDQTLDHAPDSYSSVHGVASTLNKRSDFTEDEYVVYSPDQQKMCYLVEFTVGSEKPIPMEIVPTDDSIDTNTDPTTFDKINLKDVKDVSDPMSKVKPGLVADGKDVNPVELQSVNVFGKLMDLVAEVKVLQHYHNNSDEMLEGKYVFPLDEMAAVCGFEAYINDKHVVGEVKEKETAHREYKKAISEGHGAYLMDQDEESPDVFTVSVGNVPANATVVIKITYVTELQVEGDLVSFRLPGSLAPWKQSSQDNKNIECFVAVAVDMPFDLRNIHSPTHKIIIMDFDGDGPPKKVRGGKPQGSRAMMAMEPDQTIGEGFQLLLELAEAHVPRMWVEHDEDNPTNQACMLTFYPEFEACEDSRAEVILMLDLSNSMTDQGLNEAKKVLLLTLHHLPNTWAFNVIIFGTTFRELFPSSQPKNKSNVKAAEVLIQSVDANMGNTDLYRPLHSFYLLKPESMLRNVFLVSDGHINHQDVTMDTVHRNSQHTRVFTFGVSNVMNRHLLGALARVGAGAFEGFDSKAKSKWEDKVKSQIAKAGQPGLTSVAVSWQQEDGAPTPKQAPNQITALFSGSRMVVYGFVQNCTSATLTAEIGDQEISAVVTNSDRYVTRGKILHRLAAKAIIRDWEDGLLSSDGLNQQRMKMDLKDYVIRLSKQFCIVTQLTSFIAVEKREKDEEMTSSPDIEDLLEIEQQDICAYLRPDINMEDFWEVFSDSDEEGAEYSDSYDETSDGEEEEEEEEEDYYEMCETYEVAIPMVEVMSEEEQYEPFICARSSSYSYEEKCEDIMDECMDDVYEEVAVDEVASYIPEKEMALKAEYEDTPMVELAKWAASDESDESDDDMGFGLFDGSSVDQCTSRPRVVADDLLSLSADLETDSAVFSAPRSFKSKGPTPPANQHYLLPAQKHAGRPPPAPRSAMSFQLAGPPPPPPPGGMAFKSAALPPPPPQQLAMALKSAGPARTARKLTRESVVPPPPHPQSAMSFQSVVPPPPPPPADMAFQSAAPPPPPPPADMAFQSAAPPPPPPPAGMAFQSIVPPPPAQTPAMSSLSAKHPHRYRPSPLPAAMAFKSAPGPPPPPPPPPPQSAMAFQSIVPPAPAQKPAMFSQSAKLRPPHRYSPKSAAGSPPPPPPHPAMPFSAESSAPPPIPQPKRFSSSRSDKDVCLSSSRPILPKFKMVCRSAGPPPLQPQSMMYSRSGAPSPPQQSMMASRSAGAPPPPQQSMMASRSGPPPLQPQSMMAVGSAGPPPPPPQSMMYSRSGPPPLQPQSMIAVGSAGPPPPPPQSVFKSSENTYLHAGLNKKQQADSLLPMDKAIHAQYNYKASSSLIMSAESADRSLEGKSSVVSRRSCEMPAANMRREANLLELETFEMESEVMKVSEVRKKKKKAALKSADENLSSAVSWRSSEMLTGKMQRETKLLELKKVALEMESEVMKMDSCLMSLSGPPVPVPRTSLKSSLERPQQPLHKLSRRLGATVSRAEALSSIEERGMPADRKTATTELLLDEEQPRLSRCMGTVPQRLPRGKRLRSLRVDGEWIQDKETPEERKGFCAKVLLKRQGTEPLDVGSKMPTIAKAVGRNLSKKDFDILKCLQNEFGGWTRSQVEKGLFIDFTACIEALNTAGLKSLGLKVAMEMENVLVTAFVVMWMLKTLVPELFPLNTSTRSWSDNVMIAVEGALEIYDHDRSLVDKAIAYCDQTERSYPAVSSTLELGPNWFEVALKMLVTR